MNLDLGGITGFFAGALNLLFGLTGVSTETGNGLLGFLKFFEMIGDFFIKLFQKLTGGFAK
ncbi:MAG: hypothetical protein FWF60_01100 [Oscillospiraceae bacterium]|nr:hypothetical protein [Oscillospiraceae bacterium]